MSRDAEARSRQRLGHRLAHAGDRLAVDLLSVHPDLALQPGGVQHVALGAVGAEDEVVAAKLEFAGGDHDRRGAVAEQDGGRAILGVGDPRQRLRRAHEHHLGAPGLDQRRRLVDAVQEARAGGVEVGGTGTAGADRVRHARRHRPAPGSRAEIVQTITWSTSAASIPASASARSEAVIASAASASSPGSISRRWRMPVRRTIHSSDVSSRAAISSLPTTRSGTLTPMPNSPAVRRASRRGRGRGSGREATAGEFMSAPPAAGSASPAR